MTIKQKIINFLNKNYREKSDQDHKSQIQALDLALEVCEKHFVNEVEFEFKKMKIKVKQDGAKIKALNILEKNFNKSKEIQSKDLNQLMEAFKHGNS